MSSFIGGPDFQQQGTSPYVLLNHTIVNLVFPTTIDLTAFVDPYMLGMLLFWQPSAGSGSSSLDVTVYGNLNTTPFIPRTTLQAADWAIGGFAGTFITDDPGGTLLADLDVPSGSITPINGDLFIYGYHETPLHVPRRPWAHIGEARGASVVTAAGGTNNILAAAPAGRYFRIRSIGVTPVGAPAAAATVDLFLNPLAQFIWRPQFSAAAGGDRVLALDLSTTNAIRCTNNLSVNSQTTISYEEWPIS